MRIAVVGSGISGLAAAWLLSRQHDVVLFEANNYLGGHTHTHDIELQSRKHPVDTGFSVHNPVHYPLLPAFFNAPPVAPTPTQMAFSAHNEAPALAHKTP